MNTLVCVVHILACLTIVRSQLDLRKFVPFGTSEGDLNLTQDDQYSDPIPFTYKFYNTEYTQVFISTNGFISAVTSDDTFAGPFPEPPRPMMAVFSDDPDVTQNGAIYYRVTTDLKTLRLVSTLGGLTANKLFAADKALIITWDRVRNYDSDIYPGENTFQFILATSGSDTWAIFHYGQLDWAPYTVIGFNSGDTRFWQHALSDTMQIVEVAQTSNVGENGRHIYRVDQNEVEL